MDKQNILLIAHGNFDRAFLEKLATDVRIAFNMPVIVDELHIELAKYYNPNRRQYDGNKLLQMINTFRLENTLKTIGLFRVDLFIPILTYIFGQAIFRGTCGIASLYRLRNEQYGMMPDEMILYERFLKVIIHELGHTFGLVHCHLPSCVMRSSTYVEDIDQKKIHFCPNCLTELQQVYQK